MKFLWLAGAFTAITWRRAVGQGPNLRTMLRPSLLPIQGNLVGLWGAISAQWLASLVVSYGGSFAQFACSCAGGPRSLSQKCSRDYAQGLRYLVAHLFLFQPLSMIYRLRDWTSSIIGPTRQTAMNSSISL